MAATERITMTMRELDRLKMIQAVAETGLKPDRAAEPLGLSVRQVERLVLRYREHGPAGVASGRRGRRVNALRQDCDATSPRHGTGRSSISRTLGNVKAKNCKASSVVLTARSPSPRPGCPCGP
jgi:transposase